MKLLVLSLLVAVAAASPLLGSDRCTWGPSYWCSHIKAAKECNAVKHCISTVWKNQKLPAVTDENCDVCQFVFQEIDTALENNATEDGKSGELCQFCEDSMKEVQNKVKDGEKQVLAYLEKACSIIPDANISAQCKSMVDEFFPEIMQLIIAKLDPKTICTALGFCTHGFVAKPETKVQKQKPLDNILGHVQLIKTQSKAPVKAGPSEECEMCKLIMTAARAEIKNNKTEVKVFIPKDTSDLKKAGLSEECEMCKLGIAELRKITTDEEKEQEIEAFIEKYLCGNLGSMKDECDKLVVQFGPMIFNFLAQEMDPETLCRAIGLCTSAKKPLMSLLKETNGVQTMSQVPMQMMSPATKKLTARASAQCIVCEFLVSKLESELKDNATEQEIIDAVNKGCSYLPASVADECHAVVNQYGKVIISLLVNDVDAEKICTFIGLCKPTKRVPKYVFGNEACVLCETVAMYLQALLKENSTEVAIRQELERVCNFLPDTEASICDGLIVMYGDKIILALANKISPKDLCQFVDLCPKSNTYQAPKLIKDLKVDVKSIEFCPICEMVVNKIDEFLKENSTEAMIVQALDKVCSYMPTTVKAECDDFVKQYGPMVIKLLALQINPKEVCTKLGLCTSTTQANKVAAKIVKSTVSCEVCQLAAGYLDALLEMNATEAQIKAALNQLCGYLPASVKTECDALVEQYGPIIIKLMIQELSPSVICQELGLCSSQKAPVKKVKSATTCEFCTLAVGYLDALLEKNSTEAQIEAALNQLCGYLPSSVKTECDDLVKQYGPIIIKLLAQELQASEICKLLGLCSTQKAPVEKLRDAASCEVCKLAIGYLDALLEKNSTEAQIEAALNQLCGYLPSSVKTECDDLVKQYGPIIIKLLAEELKPSVICKALGLCTSQKVVATTKPHLLGEEKCTYGPSYWCANFDNAKKCNAVEHCNKHVWKNEV